MFAQVIGVLRMARFIQVARASAQNPPALAQLPCNQAGAFLPTNSQRNINPLTNQIYKLVAHAQHDADIGILRLELGDGRCDMQACQAGSGRYAQYAAGCLARSYEEVCLFN